MYKEIFKPGCKRPALLIPLSHGDLSVWLGIRLYLSHALSSASILECFMEANLNGCLFPSPASLCLTRGQALNLLVFFLLKVKGENVMEFVISNVQLLYGEELLCKKGLLFG